MFNKQQGETIEILLDRLDKFPWKHQHEKVGDLKRCLNDLREIDKMIKILNAKFPSSLQIMEGIDHEVTGSFHHAMFHIIERILEFMKEEDESLERLNIILKNNYSDSNSISETKNAIAYDEEPEKGYAHRVRYWIIRMRKTVRKAYKENKVAILRDFDHILHDASKHMKRLEKHIDVEKKQIKEAKEPIHV